MKDRLLASTTRPVMFLLVSSTDHVTPVTGVTPTVTISKNGGAFAAPSGAVAEIANGWYALAANATDRNTLGDCLLHATGTGADPTDAVFTVVAYDPFDAIHLGLSSLPNVSPAATGGLPTVDSNNNIHGVVPGTGTGQLNPASGKVPATVGSTDYSGNTVQTANISDLIPARFLMTGGRVWALDDSGNALANAASQGQIQGVTDELGGLIEDVSGNRFTAKALEEAPTGGGDPLSNPVPGSYAVGTAGYDIAATNAKVGSIGSGSITSSGPMTGGATASVIIGDSYYYVDARQLSWSATTWNSLVSGSVVLNVRAIPSLQGLACTIVNAGSSPQTVYVELSDAQTSLLYVGDNTFDVVATLSDDHVVTLIQAGEINASLPGVAG